MDHHLVETAADLQVEGALEVIQIKEDCRTTTVAAAGTTIAFPTTSPDATEVQEELMTMSAGSMTKDRLVANMTQGVIMIIIRTVSAINALLSKTKVVLILITLRTHVDTRSRAITIRTKRNAGLRTAAGVTRWNRSLNADAFRRACNM